MNELRSVSRFDLSIPATISHHNGTKDIPFIELTTKNISSAGAYFVTGETIQQGMEVKISLKFPNLWPMEPNRCGATVSLTGKIVRTESGGIAVAFKNNFRFTPSTAAVNP